MSNYQEITIRLPDGYNAYARLFKASSATDEPKGAVLYLHGIQSHAGWYEPSAEKLQSAGYTVLQPDRRGSGQNQIDRGHADSHTQLLDDGAACLDRLLQEANTDKAHLLGVSWGGKLVAAMHATRPEHTESLILVTPGLFPKVGVSKADMFRIGMSMVSAPRRHYDIPLNDPAMFTSNPEKIDFLKADSLQIHQATAGFFLASRRLDRVAAKLGKLPDIHRVPLLLLLAADEVIIDNEKTREFIRDLDWPRTLIITYENSRHTLEFDPDKESYFNDLLTWTRSPAPISP